MLERLSAFDLRPRKSGMGGAVNRILASSRIGNANLAAGICVKSMASTKYCFSETMGRFRCDNAKTVNFGLPIKTNCPTEGHTGVANI